MILLNLQRTLNDAKSNDGWIYQKNQYDFNS